MMSVSLWRYSITTQESTWFRGCSKQVQSSSKHHILSQPPCGLLVGFKKLASQKLFLLQKQWQQCCSFTFTFTDQVCYWQKTTTRTDTKWKYLSDVACWFFKAKWLIVNEKKKNSNTKFQLSTQWQTVYKLIEWVICHNIWQLFLHSPAKVIVPLQHMDVHQHGPTGVSDVGDVFATFWPASQILNDRKQSDLPYTFKTAGNIST